MRSFVGCAVDVPNKEPTQQPSFSTQPDVLVWRDVCVQTKKSKDKTSGPTQIVKKVSGFSVGGTATGIMGPSGCGKTSLLNVLALGKHSGNTTVAGDIMWNGTAVSRSRLSKFVGYVHQEDALLGVFTPRELFTFSANLRLPFHFTRKAVSDRVSKVLRQLHMEAVADRVVGDEKVRGLSGGERRRVSIGVELVTSPKVLILDEPTSGLDSHIAKAVVNTLIEVTKENHICLLFTIHQPSSSMFRQLDKLMLMAKGEVAYFGAPLDVLSHFVSLSPVLACPELTNPAEHILDIVTGGIASQAESHDPESAVPTDESISVPALVTAWRNCSANSEQGLQDHLQRTVDAQTAIRVQLQEQSGDVFDADKTNNKSKNDSDKSKYVSSDRKAPGWYCFYIVLIREWKNFVRDPYYFGTQLCTNLFIALFVGAMFFDADNNLQRCSALYFALLNVCFVPYLSVMVRFPLARKVFNREKEAGYYGTSSFFWAYFCVDIPIQLVMTLSFSLPVYWMVGFSNTPKQFLLFNVWLYLMYQVSQSLGLACTAAFPTVTGSMAIGSLLLIIFMSFGGFFLDLGSIPVWFDWISYISLFRYAYEGLVVNELHNRTDGPEYYSTLGIKDQMGVDAAALLAMIAAYRLFTYANLRFFKGNTSL